MKRCKECNEEISMDAKKCPKCGRDQRNWFMRHAILYIILIIILLIIIIPSGSNNEQSSADNNGYNNYNNSGNSNNVSNVKNKKVYGFNEKFIFDKLEITIGNNYEFTILDNQFSEYNNSQVVKLPITVKNISNDTHGLNMFYYKIYGSRGTEVNNFSSYFDECIEYAGDLRSGAEYTKYLYFLYDGNGKYVIEFKNYSQKLEVEFEINN
ncbi:MAG: hypothetical protein IJ809_06080 [Clostridia bacterium]|nr:hypothetical protein [Clostridia bacterium]